MILQQLQVGRDLALGEPMAQQLGNFVYVLGADGQALLVDPAFDPRGMAARAREQGLEVVGVLATHYHADHVGGSLYGHHIPGVAELASPDCPVYVHEADAHELMERTGVPAEHLRALAHADGIPLGEAVVRILHTPGHTPGSCCYLAGEHLLTGDTLFTRGCGRMDLPGGSSQEMWRSLNRRLAALPAQLKVWPGHDYGEVPTATLGELRRSNPVLQVPTVEIWAELVG